MKATGFIKADIVGTLKSMVSTNILSSTTVFNNHKKKSFLSSKSAY